MSAGGCGNYGWCLDNDVQVLTLLNFESDYSQTLRGSVGLHITIFAKGG